MTDTDFIVDFVRKVIKEEKEKTKKPKPKGKKYGRNDIIVGYGAGKSAGGRFIGSVNEAGALAKEDPGALMNNLGVKAGGSGLKGAEKILKAAISSTEAMKIAFGNLTAKMSGARGSITVKPGKINSRNGANLLHHVLVGAQGAGIFNAPEAVQLQVYKDTIVVHISPYKNSWGE